MIAKTELMERSDLGTNYWSVEMMKGCLAAVLLRWTTNSDPLISHILNTLIQTLSLDDTASNGYTRFDNHGRLLGLVNSAVVHEEPKRKITNRIFITYHARIKDESVGLGSFVAEEVTSLSSCCNMPALSPQKVNLFECFVDGNTYLL
jgi:hypothetical protein